MTMKIKLILDVAMLAGMFFSMSLHLFGPGAHKMIGLLTFLLFIAHNLLNKKWYKSVFKGTYTPLRMAHSITNFTVIFSLIGVMISGVMLSVDLAAGLGDTMSIGRILHNLSSYTGAIAIALHIGFHLKRRMRHDD